ncbi:MAG: PhoH family protein [Fusobacteriota bacterium]
MVKTYVLDTNVLIHDPNAIFSFEDNEVVLPIYVIEEIDKLKKNQNDVGRAARKVARNIDNLRERGSISDWVNLDNGGKIRVENEGDVKKLPDALNRDLMDNRILAVAQYLHNKNKDSSVIVVTKDLNLRIKADSLKIKVEDYETDSVKLDELYSGEKEVKVEDKYIDEFFENGHIKASSILKEDISANEFINLKSNIGNKSALAIYNKSRDRIQKLRYEKSQPWGLTARNREQRFAMDMLMNTDIKIVTLIGKAGTGKTLLALATGLEQVVEKKDYKKLFVARPIMPMGKDIGYLPGSEKDKLRPWMQPIYDNFTFLTENRSERESENVINSLESMGKLKVEAITYIRGRSIPQGFIIIDEAQNLTPHEIKTIVTRAGEDTKIVFTGDPYQIDNPYLDANTNGLTYLAERFKKEEISGHITFIKGERSELAELAAKLL